MTESAAMRAAAFLAGRAFMAFTSLSTSPPAFTVFIIS